MLKSLMFLECLQREMAVCHHGEIEAFLADDPGRWHVVSIREPDHPEAILKDALKAHAVVFEDVLSSKGTHGHGPKATHLEGILRFVQNSGQAPLLFQCWAGRSRSTAVALVVIVKSLWDQGMDGPELVRTAADIRWGRPSARRWWTSREFDGISSIESASPCVRLCRLGTNKRG
jgi:predicted protein tyrosine phosphatase